MTGFSGTACGNHDLWSWDIFGGMMGNGVLGSGAERGDFLFWLFGGEKGRLSF